MKFILKLKKLRKTEKESFDTKKTLEDGTSDDKLSKIFRVSKLLEQRRGGKRHADSKYFFRRVRKPATPKFLSRQ